MPRNASVEIHIIILCVKAVTTEFCFFYALFPNNVNNKPQLEITCVFPLHCIRIFALFPYTCISVFSNTVFYTVFVPRYFYHDIFVISTLKGNTVCSIHRFDQSFEEFWSFEFSTF